MAAPSANQVVERAFCLAIFVVFGKTVAGSGTLPSQLPGLSAEKGESVAQTVSKIAGQFLTLTQKFGVMKYFSKSELRTVVTPYALWSDGDLMLATWRLEALQILLWALGIVAEIPPCDVLADDDLVNRLDLEKFEELRSSAKHRALEDIESARERAELWHWRSRTRELIEEQRPFPVEIPQFKSYDEIVRFSAKAAQETGALEVMDEDFAIKGKAYRDLTVEEWSTIKSITMERHFALNWLCGHAPGNRWDETPTAT